MVLYNEYLNEINDRKKQGLQPKPIDDGALLDEIISNIKDPSSPHREQSLTFFIFNTLPGTTGAAASKARMLKEIITGAMIIDEISSAFAFELLSHMKGGPSINVLLDLALGENPQIARDAADVMKTQVFLYDADMARLKKAYDERNPIAKQILESYSKAEFYTKLEDIDDQIKVVA